MRTILQYPKGLRDQSITYGNKDELLIEGYLDLDWAGNKEIRKSISEFIFMLNGGPVKLVFKKPSYNSSIIH